MPIRCPSYVFQTPRRGCFYFRMKVPLDLQECIGKKELRASLRTGYTAEAHFRARVIAGRVQQLFRKILVTVGENYDMTELDRAKINDIICSYIKECLDINESFRINRKSPYTDEEIDHQTDIIKSRRADTREELAKCDYHDAGQTVDRLVDDHGLQIERRSEEYNTLCREVLKANIALLDVAEQRTVGIYNSPEEVNLRGIYLKDGGTQTAGQGTSMVQPQQTSATMKEAGEDFWNEYNQDWKPRSRTDYRNVIDQIVAGFGPDTQLNTIDYSRVKEFREGLRDGSLTKYGKPLSTPRINFLLAVVKRIFDLAMKQDKNLDRINPADGLQLRDKRKPSEKRDVFTKEDLQKLFMDSKEYGQNKHTKAANFWIPLLGLYTGARMEELCQLLIEDVVKRDGVWCIDIRDDNAKRKSVKTGERRIVPLHPFLIDDLRFPEYIQSIDPKKKRVFHELVYVNDRWGHGFGQWFGKFKKRAGIEAEAGMKSFHSFRHTLINQLKQNEADPQYVKEFVGHKSGKDITWDLYGKSFRPATLMEKVV